MATSKAVRALGQTRFFKFSQVRCVSTSPFRQFPLRISALREKWFEQYSNATSIRYTDNVETKSRHILRIDDLSKDEVVNILNVATVMKKSSKDHEALRQQRPTTKWGQHYAGHDRFSDVLKGCSLLTLFDKPSLRTRLALEVGMHQLGGQAIFYRTGDSPLGQKESIEDTGRVLSRMCNGITARVESRNAVRALAAVSSVPVINALDDYAHPTQMLADLLTIQEHKGTWEGITMAFVGDLKNNITYDIMRTSSLMGFDLRLAGAGEIEESVWNECRALQSTSGGKIEQFATAEEALKDVDVIYCDTWMSYGTAPEEVEQRRKLFMPFQVTAERLKLAKPDCVFMNCLPAARDMEQTAEVLDGPQSIVFDQAENTLHALKALLTFVMAPARFQRCMEG